MAFRNYAPTYSNVDVGTATGARATEYGGGENAVHKTVLTFDALAFTVTDALAYYGTKIYDFPAGRMLVLGCTGSLAFTTASTIASTINSAADMDWALGTATASNITLDTTMVDIL